MTTDLLLSLAPARRAGRALGIPSVCSAHPGVIGAALALGRARGAPVLIEATCNQVNHEGGYTGLTPEAFVAFVHRIAAQEGGAPDTLILGGDHLGPNPWTALPAEAAMDKAEAMVAAYVRAGFTKIHLDASMACADDPVPLPPGVIAARNAGLAAVAERARSGEAPVYVIGTEVPVPGGAWEEVEALTVTRRADAAETVAAHRAAFSREGIATAFDRVVGLVVQPGVEFGNENVVPYDPAAARDLVAGLADLPMLFEAHSTDYQTREALAALVRDGFGILKVGPGLTFAVREALYGLDRIAEEIAPGRPATLRARMEALMIARPAHWQKYYPGDARHQQRQRHFSYSDRIRYYWPDPEAEAAVRDLMTALGNAPIPGPLISQFLGASAAGVAAGQIPPTAPALLRAAVTRVLTDYAEACAPVALA